MQEKRIGFMTTERAAIAWVVVLLGTSGLILAWPWFKGVLKSEAAAGWVQAIGSIAAILATVLVMREQHRNQIQLIRLSQREQEMLQVNRALLAMYGDLNSSSELGQYFAEERGKPSWPFSYDFPAVTDHIAIDLDSLAFLVARQGQDVLNDFSQIRTMCGTLKNMQNGLADYMSEKIEPLLEAALLAKGADLTRAELERSIGQRRKGVLAERVHDLGMFALSVNESLLEGLPGLLGRIQVIYPEIVLPSNSARRP